VETYLLKMIFSVWAHGWFGFNTTFDTIVT